MPLRPSSSSASFLLTALAGLALAALLAACSSSSAAGQSHSDSSDAGPGPLPDGAPAPDGSPAPGPTPPYPVDPTTTLVVGLDAEDFRQTLGVDLEKVRLTTKVDGQPATDETIDLRSGNAIPHETTLRAPKGKKDAAVEILVEGFVAEVSGMPPPVGGSPANVVRRATTRFVPDAVRILPLRLEARCASVAPPLLGGAFFLGPTCDAPTTCIADKCQAAAVEPASLPAYAKSWDTDMPDACRASAPSLAVGGGELDYAPLADGATVQLVEGGQCGHHLWIGVKISGMRQYGVTTTITSVSPGSALAGPASRFAFAYGDAGGGACELGGLRYQLDGATGGSWKDFLGKPLDVTVKVTDPVTGKSQTSTLHLQIDSTYVKGPRPCG